MLDKGTDKAEINARVAFIQMLDTILKKHKNCVTEAEKFVE